MMANKVIAQRREVKLGNHFFRRKMYLCLFFCALLRIFAV